MLSYETRSKLADFLLAVADGERQVEVVRQVLCEQNDFEPYAAFKRIDRLRKGTITATDIVKFLADNGIYHTERHCSVYIKAYDIDKDDRLSYTEFLQSVLPMENPDLRTHTTQRPNYPIKQDEFLPYDVEYALSKVIDREITFYLNLDYCKLNLHNRYDFNAIDAYGAIDRLSNGCIDFNNLSDFFRNQAIEPKEEELVAILRRIDRDDDGRISYQEFSESLELSDTLLKAGTDKPTDAFRRAEAVSHAKIEAKIEKSIENAKDRVLTGSAKKRVSFYGDVSYEKKSHSPMKMISHSPVKTTLSPTKEASIVKTASPLKAKLEFSSHSGLKGRGSVESTQYATSAKKVTDRGTSPVKNNEIFNSTEAKSIKYSPPRVSPARKRAIEEAEYTEKLLRSFEKARESKFDTSFGEKSPGAIRHHSPIRGSPNKLKHSQVSTQFTPGRGSTKCDETEFEALMHTFRQFIALDKELEIGKQDLALRPDFNILDFFRTFDQEGRGAVSSIEIQDGFRKYGIYPNKEDIYLFVRKFDKDNDGKLRFSDFAEIVSPKQNEYAALLHNRTPFKAEDASTLHELFSPETRKQINKVLKLQLENETSTESLRQRLNKRHSFNTHQAFNYLDLNEDGYVSVSELREGLEKHETYVTDKELRYLMDRLDVNKDNKISYSEFVQEITPKSDKPFQDF